MKEKLAGKCEAAEEQQYNNSKLEFLRNSSHSCAGVLDLGRQGAEAVSIGCCWWLSGFLGSTGARRAIVDTQTDFFLYSIATHRQHKDTQTTKITHRRYI